MTRAELIKSLESLEGPSREMDAEIALCVGYRSRGSKTRVGINNEVWAAPGELFSYGTQPPHYTSAIDSALTLVPEGWFWWLGHLDETDRRFVATISQKALVGFPAERGFSQSPAIALTIAALKAQESTNEEA